MNSGSGGRLPQHQKLQVASGHPGVDPEFESMRKDMYKKIEELMKEKKMVPENLVPDIARRFEEAMYRQHPTKDDYYNILEEPIGPHLNNAIRTITAQGQQRQQMSRQITSSSSYVTMIPTPGMAQSASGNSRMPYMMDNTGGNSTAGVNNCSWARAGNSKDKHQVQAHLMEVKSAGGSGNQKFKNQPKIKFHGKNMKKKKKEKDIVCFVCGVAGHKANHCRNRKGNGPSPAQHKGHKTEVNVILDNNSSEGVKVVDSS